MKYRSLLLIPFFLLFLCGCAYSDDVMLESMEEDMDPGDGDDGSDLDMDRRDGDIGSDPDVDDPSGDTIYVYVCGEVRTPGVYAGSTDTRVWQMIDMAGGLTENAARQAVNQAEGCTDGQMIYVPAKDEEISAAVGVPKESDDGLININTADAAKLMEINGIGESRAADIISYREKCGTFDTIQDIMKVPGIKEGMFSRIKDQIKV